MRASTERERELEREQGNGSLKRAATAAEAEAEAAAAAAAAATPSAAAGSGGSARQNAFASLAELRALEQERAALLAEFAASQQRLEQQHRGVASARSSSATTPSGTSATARGSSRS